MAFTNIGASNKDDAFYRYKMPRLITKVEGRGNGIKTNLVNMVDVAKALSRPPAYTTKFFGCELGAQSKFDEKTGTSIVNGAHDTAKLAGLLENFIKKYVQCYGCGNPETEIVITKSQLITLKCAACGHVSDVDMRDKLTTFILKNPPEQKKKGSDKKGMRRAEKERIKEGEAIDEEMRRMKKESKKKKSQDETTKKKASSDEEEQSLSVSQEDTIQEEDDDDDVQWLTDTSAQAAQQRIKEQLTTATSEMVMLQPVKEPEKPPKSSNGKPKSKEISVNGDSAPSLDDEDIISLKELSLQDKLLKEFKDGLASGYGSKELASLFKEKSSSPKQEVWNAYFEALFDGVSRGLAKELKKKKKYFDEILEDEHSQELLLGAFEAHYVGLPPESRKAVEVAGSLKAFYDLDLLEEETILAWYDEGAAQKFNSAAGEVKKLTTAFVEWLRNAESEEE
ncbi:hypothetical protein KP509_31G018200 [Ceratopteris richardii]|uniref:W2 domain-containing protein n=1 Tax=Ceratopteris richardii TaxID=49495 RepID=A0A8T2QWL6_CERRI|nr:hypothetical protein KP509_31G018200 [Ceratopteris richardii]KAH7288236.1 hypothetical protein KP509_31G018200 [Ceratopteris richardii]KAH7288237.1 hypothetical protein KP509_31G018200 [Ceratopteris richardii]